MTSIHWMSKMWNKMERNIMCLISPKFMQRRHMKTTLVLCVFFAGVSSAELLIRRLQTWKSVAFDVSAEVCVI